MKSNLNLIFKSKLSPPVKPNPKDFGLDEDFNNGTNSRDSLFFDPSSFIDKIYQQYQNIVSKYLGWILGLGFLLVYIIVTLKFERPSQTIDYFFNLFTSMLYFIYLVLLVYLLGAATVVAYFIFFSILACLIAIYRLLKNILWPDEYLGKKKNFNKHLKDYEVAFIKYTNDIKIEKYEFDLRQRKYWLRLTGWSFEKQVAELFRRDGFHVDLTPGSGDGGIDLFLRKNNEIIPVQCKNYSKKVPPNDIRAFYGVISQRNFTKGILIGSSGFSDSANDYSDRIEFWELDNVLKLAERVTLK